MNKDKPTTVNVGNLKFNIVPAGLIHHKNAELSLAHSHANFEFHIILKGTAIFDLEDKNIPLQQNDSVLLFPGSFHRISKQSDDSAILSASFSISKSGNKTDTDHYSILSEYLKRETEYALIQQNPLLVEYIKNINAHLHLNSYFTDESVKALLVLLFTEMFLPIFSKSEVIDGNSQEFSEYDSRINMIENYFNDHYMEDISLSELSATLCLSEKQTNRMINKAFGSDFRECLCTIRLKSAKKLLRETQMDAKDIAVAVGYQSYNGFYLAFRTKFGFSPTEYREQKRNSREN